MGAVKRLDVATNLIADRLQGLDGGGGHIAATFLVNVTAITRTTGTMTVSLYWSPDGTIAGGIKIAEVTGLSATGLSNVPLVAPFLAAGQQAIPEPNLINWDIIGDTTAVSGTMTAIYSNY